MVQTCAHQVLIRVRPAEAHYWGQRPHARVLGSRPILDDITRLVVKNSVVEVVDNGPAYPPGLVQVLRVEGLSITEEEQQKQD